MEQEQQPKYTLETLPAKTLLHYVKKDQLEKLIPPHILAGLRRQAVEDGVKVTAKYLKTAALQEPQFLENLRRSEVGQQAYQKYATNFMRITAPEVRAKSQEVRAQMAQPRKGFMGCVATKVDPKVFRECADSYDRPEYQNIALVPSAALKQRPFGKQAMLFSMRGQAHTLVTCPGVFEPTLEPTLPSIWTTWKSCEHRPNT